MDLLTKAVNHEMYKETHDEDSKIGSKTLEPSSEYPVLRKKNKKWVCPLDEPQNDGIIKKRISKEQKSSRKVR